MAAEPRGDSPCAIFGKQTSTASKIMGRLTSPLPNVAYLGSVRSAGTMPDTTPTHNSWLNVPAKIRDVVTHHFAPDWHGRPLYLMIPGGLAAVVAGVWMFFLAKAVWVDHLRAVDAATPRLLALLVPYFVGLAIFSYAYELCNWPRAIRLTLILGAAGLAIIFVAVSLASLLRCLREKGDRKSSDSYHVGRATSSVSDHSEWWVGDTGSGPDGTILSLATCPKCGNPLLEIGAACSLCTAKAAGLTDP